MTDSEDYSVETALLAAERDELADWVQDFLASPGSDNALLGQQLTEQLQSWKGPVRLPLERLHRLAGPPDEPVLVAVDDDDWHDRVDDMAERIERGWQPAPVIVSYRDPRLVLEDGNHRVESLRRAGQSETWAVVGFADEQQRQRFEASQHPGHNGGR